MSRRGSVLLRFIFRMGFVFQNIAFLFQNVVCVSECRLLFGIAVAAVCHHMIMTSHWESMLSLATFHHIPREME